MSKVIGQIAHCEDCDWQNEAYWEARKKAYQHHKSTGHAVWGETTTSFGYYRTKPNSSTQSQSTKQESR